MSLFGIYASVGSEQGLDLIAHYAHLLVHGTLHAQGYDHDCATDARIMQSEESRVLVGLGFPDPYQRSDGRGRTRSGGRA